MPASYVHADLQVLSYHFSPEVYTTAQMYDGQKLPTLLSADATGAAFTASLLTVNKVKAMEFHPYQQTTEVSIIPSGGAPAAIVKPDIPACKVLVQVVDAVLVSTTALQHDLAAPCCATRLHGLLYVQCCFLHALYLHACCHQKDMCHCTCICMHL